MLLNTALKCGKWIQKEESNSSATGRMITHRMSAVKLSGTLCRMVALIGGLLVFRTLQLDENGIELVY